MGPFQQFLLSKAGAILLLFLQITKPECIKLIGIKEKCLIEKINGFFTLIILIFTPHKMQKKKI